MISSDIIFLIALFVLSVTSVVLLHTVKILASIILVEAEE